MAPTVLVTGVSGYVGSWVAYVAMKLGYQVRGTVRSLGNEAKVACLRDLCPGSTYKLELFEADLTSEKGWDVAVKDCDYVLHVASPFPFESPKNKDDILVPAIEGTLTVLRACANAPTPPKRVVVTSSIAAMAYGTDTKNRVYTEADQTVVDDPKFPIGTYIESKKRAEDAAWQFVGELPPEKKFELATINPSLVLGPLLTGASASSSSAIMKGMLTGKTPALPNIVFNIISVIDVAKAHIFAIQKKDAAGKRFLCDAGHLSMPEMGRIVGSEFNNRGYKSTTSVAPDFLIWGLSWFMESARGAIAMIRELRVTDPVNCKQVFGMEFDKDFASIVKSMAYTGIARGAFPNQLPADFENPGERIPDVDLSGLEQV
jgi:nucleoside-diphosphate-sugar epimerase